MLKFGPLVKAKFAALHFYHWPIMMTSSIIGESYRFLTSLTISQHNFVEKS